MITLPDFIPKDSAGAFAYLNGVTEPKAHDLKLMLLLEAGGQVFYRAVAALLPEGEARALILKNAQEEMAHAHRVRKVLALVHGEEVEVPEDAANPYAKAPPLTAVTPQMFEAFAAGETGGEALYERWATAIGHEEAARLLRQNGKEELVHAERDRKAASLLAG